MKRLIITADDFGVSEGANRGIAEGYAAGVITSASLMTNMPATDHAVEIAKNLNMKVGVHLCLAAGRPLSPASAVPSLIDADGRFWNRGVMIRKLLTRSLSLNQVAREFEAQVERFLEFGFQPDHLNSDQHVHVLPGIQKIAVDIAKLLNVPLRVPEERMLLSSEVVKPGGPLARKLSLKFLCKMLRLRCRFNRLKYNDHFISIFGFLPHQHPRIELFQRLLSKVQPGITEMMVHPAYFDEPLADFWIGGRPRALEREVELHCLLSSELQTLLASYDLRLVSYSDCW